MERAFKQDDHGLLNDKGRIVDDSIGETVKRSLEEVLQLLTSVILIFSLGLDI